MSAIDLSLLDAPQVVESLEYEDVLAEMVEDLKDRDPEFDAMLASDPAHKILEVAAYRETLLRQRVNDAARAVMLAYATAEDLDHLAALYDTERLVVDEGDPDAVPPVPPTYETDSALRARVQLAPESLSVAGPAGAYKYHALSAAADVLDVDVDTPTPGEVLITVLSASGDGTPDAALLSTVEDAAAAEDVRPLTDSVTVQAATIIPYTISATLTFFEGPDTETIRHTAEEACQDYIDSSHRLGRDVTLSGIYAALHQPGVQNVSLAEPTADIIVDPQEASYCTSLTVSAGGTDE
jgi:phage-related baseplate assembly protein